MYYGSLTVSENNREKFSDPISDVFNITLDQSVENAGVAFVKRADKRNEFFEQERQIVARHARLTPSCKAGARTGQNSSMKNNKGH